jgi:hypothetical protein
MNKDYSQVGFLVAVSAFLGFGTPLVAFVSASAFETPATTSIREVTAMCVATALYLAFCQFWVAPRGSGGFVAKLPTLIAAVVPLLVFVKWTPRAHGIPWVLASGCLGSVTGAMIAHWLTATPQRGTPTADSINRGSRRRRYLLAGFILLGAVALVIPIGVIPSALADTTPGLNAGAFGVILGITVVFDLLAAALLAFALWRRREDDHFSKGILGSAAFVAALLAVLYALMSGVGGHGTALRVASVLLILCAVFGLITTALMIVTSVIVDRARLRA